MKDLPKRVLFGAIVTLLLLSCTAPAFAMDTGSVGGRPAYPQRDNQRSEGIFIRTIEPEKSVDDGLLLINYTTDSRNVTVGAVDSTLSSDGSFSCKQDADKQSEVGTWIKIPTKEVVLAPREQKIVPLSISVPKGASPGEHDGCVTIQDHANLPKNTGDGIRLGFRTATRVVITVPGQIVKEAIIEKIVIDRDKNGKYTVNPIIKNNGNVSLDISANAQLRSRFGEQTPVQNAEFPILNGSSTGWKFEFTPPFWGGFYKAMVSIAYNNNTSESLGVNPDGSKKKVKAVSTYFFVLPQPKALAIELTALLSPIASIAWIIFALRRRKKRALWAVYAANADDTLQSIALDRGIKWKRLAKANHIKKPYVIQTGQKLLVPPISSDADVLVNKAPKGPADAALQLSTSPSPEVTPNPSPASVSKTKSAPKPEPIFLPIAQRRSSSAPHYSKPSVTPSDINSVLFNSVVSTPNLVSHDSKQPNSGKRSSTNNKKTAKAPRSRTSRKA